MNFESTKAKTFPVTVDGKEYTASTLTVTDLNDAAQLIYRRAMAVYKQECDKLKPEDAKPDEPRLMSVREAAYNLVFNNPQLALFAAVAHNHADVKFEDFDALNLTSNESVEFVAQVVGVELAKKA